MSGLGAEAPRGDAVTTMEVEVCGDESAATFTFHNEDHTIGNTVRYMLNKMPETSFVGYSVPHPAEPKMNLRLQTVGPPATQVLHEALAAALRDRRWPLNSKTESEKGGESSQ